MVDGGDAANLHYHKKRSSIFWYQIVTLFSSLFEGTLDIEMIN
jgi:hypothetical protein